MPPLRAKQLGLFLLLELTGWAVAYWVSSNSLLHQHFPEHEKILLAVHGVQESIRIESGHYPRDLVVNNYRHPSLFRYIWGFSEKCRISNEPLNLLQLPEAGLALSNWKGTEQEKVVIQELFDQFPCPQDFPNQWEIFAIGNIGGEQLDAWKINQDKSIQHVLDGQKKEHPARDSTVLLSFLIPLVWILAVLWARGLSKDWSLVLKGTLSATVLSGFMIIVAILQLIWVT